MPALMPARNPMPSVWAERISGKANIDSPRTHIESGICSTQSKAASMGVTAGSAEPAQHRALRDQRQQPMTAVDHGEHRLALLKGVADRDRRDHEAEPDERARNDPGPH